MKQKYSGQKFLHPEVELFSVSISLSVEERRHLHSDTPRCKTSGGCRRLTAFTDFNYACNTIYHIFNLERLLSLLSSRDQI